MALSGERPGRSRADLDADVAATAETARCTGGGVPCTPAASKPKISLCRPVTTGASASASVRASGAAGTAGRGLMAKGEAESERPPGTCSGNVSGAGRGRQPALRTVEKGAAELVLAVGEVVGLALVKGVPGAVPTTVEGGFQARGFAANGEVAAAAAAAMTTTLADSGDLEVGGLPDDGDEPRSVRFQGCWCCCKARAIRGEEGWRKKKPHTHTATQD